MSDDFKEAKLQMAIRLRMSHRIDESSAMLKEIIGADPTFGDAFYHLAINQLLKDERPKVVLETVDQAIAVDPEDSDYYALRADVLANMKRSKDAHAAADEATRIDPDNTEAHLAKSSAFISEMRWADAEQAVRRALELNGDHETATNRLAQLQRLQGKMDENAQTVQQLLAENPESPRAHCNAGWAALQKSDHKTANNHFREALRLDPSSDNARAGLLESFKARNPLYRAYLKYNAFMLKFTHATQWIMIIGIYVAYRLLKGAVETVSPLAATLLMVAYLLFVLWVWLASGIGHGMILLDRYAKHVLRPKEKWEGLFVGGGIVLGLVLAITGIISGMRGVAFIGGFIGLATMPASLTFTNESVVGRWIFGSLFGAMWLGALGGVIFAIMSAGQSVGPVEAFFWISVLATMLCTWVGNIPALRERR